MEEKDVEDKQKASIINYFQGATIHNIVVNGNMIKNAPEQYNTQGENGKQISAEHLSRALKECEVFIWGNAAYSIAFCVCRDLYNLENNASNFERLLAEAGFEIPEGTINAALNRNTWMRLNIEKWERHGAKQRALKLRDEFRRQMDLLGFVAKQAEE